MNHRYSINRIKILFVFLLFITTVHPALYADLASVSVSAGNATAGVASIHTISFTIAIPIPADGRIVIIYPAGFTLSSDAIVSSTTMIGSLSASMVGNSIILQRNAGGVESGGKSEIIKIANVTNSTVSNIYPITVQTENNTGTIVYESGTYNSLTINPGSFDHFSISSISNPQVSGTPLSITITPQDVNNNTVTLSGSTVNLTDMTGPCNPPQVIINGSNWTGNVIITKSYSNDALTVTGEGKSSKSNLFNVNPASLDHFIISNVTSPQIAGTPFSVTLTAKDVYENTVTGFIGTVGIYTGSGTVSPSASGVFTNGVRTESLIMTQSQNDATITVSDGSGHSGTSNKFNVLPGTMTHFHIDPIADQATGLPFVITVTAKDVNDNTVASFNGASSTVSIARSVAGGIQPNVSGPFSAGIWIGSVQITQTITSDQITVTRAGGITGTSNTFRVSPSAVDHFSISSISNPQVSGTPFSITITPQDANNNTVTLSGSTVNLTDMTGPCNPPQVIINGSNWTGNVIITKSYSNDALTVTGEGKSSKSNLFNVNPASLDHFIISNVTSPQIAGTPFSVTLTAKDVYENTVTGFIGTVGIYTGSGTVSPSTSGVFASGVRTISNMTLSLAQDDATITVSDGSGHSGTSNKFNVVAGSVSHFDIDPIADQATTVPFVITISAKDANENIVKSFNGAGNTVGIAHSGSGSIQPVISTPFVSGVWTGSVQILLTQVNDRITVTRTSGIQTGISNSFRVTPSSIDHFLISSIGLAQSAGVGFSVTITAQDANNNTVSGFSGTANLTDATGTSSPQQITFSNGVWADKVTITRAGVNNSLTVTGDGKSGTSNLFQILAGSVRAFDIASLASPKIAGTSFQLLITAQDVYGNTAAGFSGTVQISDGTGTITPSISNTFGGGSITQTVTINRAQNDVNISVDDGSSHTGRSNIFNVISSTVDHFSIEPVGNQVAGVPFILTVTARDRFENTVTSFTGTVNLSDFTTTVSPSQSVNFVSGRWSGGVTVNQAVVGNQISVVRTSGTESGSSTSFNVYAPPGVRVVGFSASRTTVTVNQHLDWNLLLAVRNLSSSEAALDSLKIKFWLSGLEQNDYLFNVPATFKRSGTRTLTGNATDTLFIPVDRTGSRSGDLTVEANIYFTDRGTNGTVNHQGKTGITVQDSAKLVIAQVRTSQSEVSVGQEEDWQVTVVLSNRGGSGILLDSSWANTNLSFSKGNSWSLIRPPSLFGGGWTLQGGKTDSLIFLVDRTGIGTTGNCFVHATVSGAEINTARVLISNTQTGGYGVVKIEVPALIQITKMENLASNTPYVNVNQQFSVRVTLKNVGGDGVHEIMVGLTTSGLSSFLDLPEKIIPSLAGGSTASVDFYIQASGTANPKEIFYTNITGYVDNTSSLIPYAIEDTTKAVVQNPAGLLVERIVPSVLFLSGGQNDPWAVKVPVKNVGQAELVLDPPQPDDVTFWIGGNRQTDYNVVPPLTLKKGDLRLKSNIRDTLVYSIIHTGILGGNVEIHARILGKDKNSETKMNSSNQATVLVKSDKAFRIISTQILCKNQTEAGNGYVNINQSFQVKVTVENGLGQTLKDIQLQMRTSGSSTIQEPIMSIASLKPAEWDTVSFDVKANKKEVLSELFTASIIRAELENGLFSPPIGTSLDSVAQVTIQTPARISLSMNLSNPQGLFSSNQEFSLFAALSNTGTAEIDSSGSVRIVLPSNYTLISKSDTSRIGFRFPVVWTIKAPSTEEPIAPVFVTLYRLPKDKNTGNPVNVDIQTASIEVKTLLSTLYALNFRIVDPAGAQDNVLSCSQTFVIRASIQSQNVKDIRAQLILPDIPDGFKTADNLEKSVFTSSAEIFWQITAPTVPKELQVIQMALTGRDSLQDNVEVNGTSAAFTVRTVNPSILSLDLAILGPEDVKKDNTVSPGQDFIIGASLVNEGAADTVGIAAVTLDPLPNGYSTVEPLTKILMNGKASWTITAPFVQTGEAVSIKAKITTIPKDANTGKAATVKQGQDNVPIFIESSWLALSRKDLPQWVPSVVIPGQVKVRMMVLELDNRGAEGANLILVDTLHLNIENQFGNAISPKSVLSEITVTGDPDSNLVYGILSDIPDNNPVTIPFSLKVIVPNELNVKLAIYATIAENPEPEFFRMDLPSGSFIGAKDKDSKNPISVKSPSEEEISNMVSDAKKIFKPETEPIVWNYPNPFGGPGKEETKIVYFLKTNQEVSFKLYTLTGDLVWSYTIPRMDTNAQPGSHSILWNGRNGQGAKIMNGVYLLFMKTGDGMIERTKIAVVK